MLVHKHMHPGNACKIIYLIILITEVIFFLYKNRMIIAIVQYPKVSIYYTCFVVYFIKNLVVKDFNLDSSNIASRI
jgi:hypothetical protein